MANTENTKKLIKHYVTTMTQNGEQDGRRHSTFDRH